MFTKLFNSIVTSTIWTEDDKTRIVWITMLALADKNGEVHASIPGLAQVAAVPLEDCEKAINKLLSPDKYSRTPDFGGRRIAPIPGGWELLNYAKYRAMASREDSKAAAVERVKRHRKRTQDVTPVNAVLTPCNAVLTPCNASLTQNLHIAEAEAEAKEEPHQTSPRGGGSGAFDEFWKVYPRKVGKEKARTSFRTALRKTDLPTILAAVEAQSRSEQWQKENGRFVPNPATWLNQGRWEDEVEPQQHHQKPKTPAWLPANWREIAESIIGPKARTLESHSQVPADHRYEFEIACRESQKQSSNPFLPHSSQQDAPEDAPRVNTADHHQNALRSDSGAKDEIEIPALFDAR